MERIQLPGQKKKGSSILREAINEATRVLIQGNSDYATPLVAAAEAAIHLLKDDKNDDNSDEVSITRVTRGSLRQLIQEELAAIQPPPETKENLKHGFL